MTSSTKIRGKSWLNFRCTGCGNCCRDPRLPLTHRDVVRIAEGTGDAPAKFIDWLRPRQIAMNDEPEWFVRLPDGKRVMALRHQKGSCRYLGKDDLCTIYESRPTGCRLWPFDPTFSRKGNLRELTIAKTVECPFELNGSNDIDEMRTLNDDYTTANEEYEELVAEWNDEQRRRKRAGKKIQSANRFVAFITAA